MTMGSRWPDFLPGQVAPHEEAACTLSSTRARREKLEAAQREFFARGGTVRECAPGCTEQGVSSPHRPKRLDGSVPAIKKSPRKYHIDEAELLAHLQAGLTTGLIAEHYMTRLGCSKPLVVARLGKLKAKLAKQVAA